MQGLSSQVCGTRYGPRSAAQAQTTARYIKKAQPQGELRCTYETTNKPNKPNTIIDSPAVIVFNSGPAPPFRSRDYQPAISVLPARTQRASTGLFATVFRRGLTSGCAPGNHWA
jgi:hypothetical protein